MRAHGVIVDEEFAMLTFLIALYAASACERISTTTVTNQGSTLTAIRCLNVAQCVAYAVGGVSVGVKCRTCVGHVKTKVNSMSMPDQLSLKQTQCE